MNMHPKSTAPADDELQDLDLSRSGHNAPEVVGLDCATATIFGEIDGGGEPCGEESLAAAKVLLEDDTDPLDLVATEWVNSNADLRHLSSAAQNVIDEIDQLAAEPLQGINPPLSDVECIHPVKAAATSGLAVAFHGDHLKKVFDTERGEGEHLDLGGAVDPDPAIFRLHADGEIMKPINGFAQFFGDTIDGLYGVDLDKLHGQAA